MFYYFFKLDYLDTYYYFCW